MALTPDFQQSILERAERDPAFVQALLAAEPSSAPAHDAGATGTSSVVLRHIGMEEQEVHVYVNGQRVACATYDALGWEGLALVKRMARDTAKALGVEPEEHHAEE